MHKIYAAKSMFAAPSTTLESDESVNGAATDRGRTPTRRTDDNVSIQRSWFDSIAIDGVEQNLIRIPDRDRVRERQGGRPPRWAPSQVPARRRRECDHAQARRQCTCAMAKAGGLPGCLLYDHAARRGALPVGE